MKIALILAATYGILVGGIPKRAPSPVSVDNVSVVTRTLPEAVANRLGYKLIEDNRPETDTNHTAVAVGWAETNRIYRVYEIRENPPPTPRKWTPRAIYVACGDRWPTVKAALEAAGKLDEFMMSQVIDEGCDSFKAGYALACSTFGKEAVDTILNAAEVTP